MSSTGNRRLDAVIVKALNADWGGQDMLILDGYNGNVITSGVVYAITTRTFGDNNHFLIEKYDG